MQGSVRVRQDKWRRLAAVVATVVVHAAIVALLILGSSRVRRIDDTRWSSLTLFEVPPLPEPPPLSVPPPAVGRTARLSRFTGAGVT
ncbi:hypothetical protein SM191_08655, partial [Sphingomonas sp. 2378]